MADRRIRRPCLLLLMFFQIQSSSLFANSQEHSEELSLEFLRYLSELEYQENANEQGEKWLDPVAFSEDLERLEKPKPTEIPI